MSNQAEKPKPATGQRWRDNWNGAEYTLGQRVLSFCDPINNEEKYRWNIEGDESRGFLEEYFHSDRLTYLGGPQPPPSTAVMEATRDGRPVRCLICNGDRGSNRWVCDPCERPWDASKEALVNAWDRGARDFPRSPAAAPAPVEVAPWQFEVTVVDCGIGPKPAPEIPASCQFERWDETGPLSALQKIQSRKPPEPWVESCDPLFWIPDA